MAEKLRKSRLDRKQLGTIGIVVGLVLLTLVGTALFIQNKQRREDLTNVDVVKARVARHYVLPSNEQPALATITDRNKLTSAFLKKAQNGDKVLIYQTNQIAIIYRPSIDRIIAVGPVAIDTPQGSAGSNSSP